MPVSQVLSSGRALLQPGDGALIRQLAGRLGDLADLAASRLLASDDLAAELALLLEELAEDQDRDEVAWMLLRHSPMLDGTLIGLLDPLMRSRGSETAAVLDPALVRRGREAILRTIAALHGGFPDAPSGALAERLDAEGLLDPFPALRPALLGQLPPDDEARFVLLSYSIFLQSWLMRHVGHSAGERIATLGGEPGSSAPPTLDATPQPRSSRDD